ncbi:uncharacterized protein LOC135467122 [Liolophura sinensis]|uniref:uncharacterized protein LOC135467122 n=1 Tax=Liolophura sinensis TaxID=3198878 RepID=UPI00315922EA
MLETWRSELVVLAFVTLELPVMMMLDCLAGKDTECRHKGSCQQSLDCKLWRYHLLKSCPEPDVDNNDFAVCDEWRNCYRAVDYCDGVKDCIDGRDEKYCCPAGTYKCDTCKMLQFVTFL